EGLGLVRPLRTEPHGAADLAGGHFFAAADDDLVGGVQQRRLRPIEHVEQRPERPLARQRGVDRPRPGSAIWPSAAAAASAASLPESAAAAAPAMPPPSPAIVTRGRLLRPQSS